MVLCLRTPFGDHRVSPPRRKRVEPRKKTVSAPAPRRANETVKARRVHVNEHVSPAAPSNSSRRLALSRAPTASACARLPPPQSLWPQTARRRLRRAVRASGVSTVEQTDLTRSRAPTNVSCHVSCRAGRCTIGIGADARGSREMLSDQEMRQQAIRRKRGSTASSTVDRSPWRSMATKGISSAGGARSEGSAVFPGA